MCLGHSRNVGGTLPVRGEIRVRSITQSELRVKWRVESRTGAVTVVSRWLVDSFLAVRFDVLDGLVVPSRCSAVGFTAFVGKGQNIFPIDLVVQRRETKVGRFLRFCMQRRLQLLNTEWSC